ncbi:hypothetical protein BD560DRAFT_434817 [Blakeslea trispora]|nr:hypothetical protein BD560DRAFT_434817 [Blakeslea trispora]
MPHQNIPDTRVALRILPFSSQNALQVLPGHKLALGTDVFAFDDIFNSENMHHLTDTIMTELMHKRNVSLVCHDASRNRFDARVFVDIQQLLEKGYELSIRFLEYDDQLQSKDLIAPDQHMSNAYHIDSVDLADKFYLFGLNRHKIGAVSVFSVLIKDTNSQFNIIDISDCSDDIMDRFSLYYTKHHHTPWLRELDASQQIIYLNCIHPSDDISTLQHTLTYASALYQQKSLPPIARSISTPLSSRSSKDEDHLHRIISRLSNEVNVLRQQQKTRGSVLSSSIYSEGPRNISMFSSLSSSTSATILTDDKTDHEVSDLYRQIEEYENQVTVTRERNALVESTLVDLKHSNQHLCQINHTQAQLIEKLEEKLNETEKLRQITANQLEMQQRLYQQHYLRDRRQIEDCLQVVQQMIEKQEQKSAYALEELITVQNYLSTRNAAHDEGRAIQEDVLDAYLQHLPEEADWQQEYEREQAKTLGLERKLIEVTADLDVCRQAIRNNDSSGLIGKLENDLARLGAPQDVNIQNQHIQHLESVVQNLNQQLLNVTHRSIEQDKQLATLRESEKQQQPISDKTVPGANTQAEQAQLMRWIYEKIDDSQGRSEVIQKFAEMCKDRSSMATKITCLEAKISNGCQLLPADSKGLKVNADQRLERTLSISTEKSRLSNMPQDESDRSSILSSCSDLRATSPISSFPAPPPLPPNNPLPPLPSTTLQKKQSNKLSKLESQLRSSEAKIQEQEKQLMIDQDQLSQTNKKLTELSLELEHERKLKQKAEHANRIMEKRMEDLMTNKKNKFRCF